jgi:hypothetical protein
MRFLLFFTALLISTSANARCYNQAEFEAEQGLRIHSELMVISLNCQQSTHRYGNLYIQYKDFTRRHQHLIAQYEQVMKNYYSRTGTSNPERAINDLRTSLANKISNDAARMKPNAFCKAYGGRITQALGMSQDKLRRWASTPFSGHPTSRPICTSG